MTVLPLHGDISKYLAERNLEKKFAKQIGFFEKIPFHPGLKTELLEPKHLKIWSFRVDRKYRAIFIFRERDVVEIIDVNDHYR